jgi:hypothetical protein
LRKEEIEELEEGGKRGSKGRKEEIEELEEGGNRGRRKY